MKTIKFRARLVTGKEREELIKKLREKQELANQYSKIARKIQEKKTVTPEEFNFIEKNSSVLQKELQKFNLGKITHELPFKKGKIENFQLILNFPILLSYKKLDEALKIIPAMIQTFIMFNNNIEEILKDPEKLKEYLGKKQLRNVRKRLNKKRIGAILGILGPLYIYSLGLLITPNNFIYGFIINLVTVIVLFIISIFIE